MSVTSAVILAAGKGTRMKSERPKVLHPICGKPMVSHVLAAVGETVSTDEVFIVVGHKAELVKEELGQAGTYVHQAEQLGTGHAVKMAAQHLTGRRGETLVLAGDTPLISGATLRALVDLHRREQAGVTLLTACIDDPTGYGRIIRDQAGHIEKIVEEKDADSTERQVREINAGIYCFDTEKLLDVLGQLSNQNAQGEYYLTDCIQLLKQSGETVIAHMTSNNEEIMGVNDRVALAQAEQVMRRMINETHMRAGVTLVDPAHTYIDVDVKIGADTVIYPGTTLAGKTVIGPECEIGPAAHLVDTEVGRGAQVINSHAREASIGEETTVGPYAHLRPGSVIGSRCRIGHFVEIKNSQIGDETKIPHLGYVGDATLGRKVNWGCGSITVNYDGAQKHRTVIEDEGFIGCNVNLVAPVTVGKGAYIAAGSTITQPVPPDSLAIARERETIKEGYVSQRLAKQNRTEKN